MDEDKYKTPHKMQEIYDKDKAEGILSKIELVILKLEKEINL